MRAQIHPDVRDFLRIATPHLIAARAFGMHILRIGTKAAKQRAAGEEKPDALWGITVHAGADDQVCAAALYSSRKALFVTPHEPEACDKLIAAVPANEVIADIVGHAPSAIHLAKQIGNYVPFIEGTLYALESAPQVLQANARVRCRHAGVEDILFLEKSTLEFIDELSMKDPREEVPHRVRERVAAGQFFLASVDDQPIAFAGGTAVGYGFGSIGPVYTHPNARHLGLKLGQRVAAFACAHLNTCGADFIVLLADKANAVSNAAYQKIGFAPQGDFAHLELAH